MSLCFKRFAQYVNQKSQLKNIFLISGDNVN